MATFPLSDSDLLLDVFTIKVIPEKIDNVGADESLDMRRMETDRFSTEEIPIIEGLEGKPRSKQVKNGAGIERSQKKMKENVEGGESSICDPARKLPDDFLFELFIKLPTKELINCVCVSKSWESIIRRPDFVYAYSHRNLCCLAIPIFNFRTIAVYCPTVGSCEPEQSVNVFNVFDKESGVLGITNVVNGLFCYYSAKSVSLANLFTHETMPLPGALQPSFLNSFRYYFGFDNVSGVYKLLRQREIMVPVNHDKPGSSYAYHFPRIWEILTLGVDSSWRKLAGFDEFPDYLSDVKGILVNGALYWIDKTNNHWYCFNHHRGDNVSQLYSFNLNQEKFGTVPLPRYKPWLHQHGYLVQFQLKLSFCCCVGKKMILCTLKEDGHHWTRHKVLLPSELWHDKPPLRCEYGYRCGEYYNLILFAGNMPNGEIFLVNHDVDDSDKTVVYCFIYKNDNKFVRTVAGKMPESLSLEHISELELGRIVCLEQNIAPLDALLQNRGGIE